MLSRKLPVPRKCFPHTHYDVDILLTWGWGGGVNILDISYILENYRHFGLRIKRREPNHKTKVKNL